MSVGTAVDVVIVTYNANAYFRRCVDAVAAQSFRNVTVTVWDNASPDGGPQAEDLPAGWRLVRHDENIGFAAANNRAAALGAAPYIALINPDAFPQPSWLAALLAALDETPEAASAGSVQWDDADPKRLDGAGDVYHASGQAYRGGYGGAAPAGGPPSGAIFGPCAAAAVYRRSAWEAAGGFDERYFCYSEDVDLAFRLRLMGWTSVLSSGAQVRHMGSASTARDSAFARYYGTRNRLWTYVKCMPWPLLAITWPLHLAVTAVLLARDVALARGDIRQASLAGVWDAIKGAPGVWAARAGVHPNRAASTWDIARALTWSPVKLWRRASDIRPARRP